MGAGPGHGLSVQRRRVDFCNIEGARRTAPARNGDYAATTRHAAPQAIQVHPLGKTSTTGLCKWGRGDVNAENPVGPSFNHVQPAANCALPDARIDGIDRPTDLVADLNCRHCNQLADVKGGSLNLDLQTDQERGAAQDEPGCETAIRKLHHRLLVTVAAQLGVVMLFALTLTG